MAYLIHTIAGSPATIFLEVLFLLMQPKIAIIILESHATTVTQSYTQLKLIIIIIVLAEVLLVVIITTTDEVLIVYQELC